MSDQFFNAGKGNVPTSCLVASRNTAANISDTSDNTLALSSLRVLPVLIAAINDDVSLLKVGHETSKYAISHTAMRQAEDKDLG